MSDSAGIKNVKVTMLGGFSIAVNGHVLTDEANRSQKLWNVLSYLLVHRDRNVPQSEFIEQFWPGENSANPVNALKTLLYRVRAMLEPLFGLDIEPILSRRGSYSWNPDIVCTLDMDEFEALCHKANDGRLSDESRLTLYRQAEQLYRGDFLPKLEGSLWIIPYSVEYHNLYLQMIKDYAALLEKKELFEEMTTVCTRASQLDSLDETLHILIVRSLLRQGNDSAALAHYESATDLLYRNLGVRPSQELRELYNEIMSVEKSLETDLETIQDDLREAAARPGAFVCEYGFFREAYRLEARRAARSGTSVHIALITVSLPDGGMPPLSVLAATMDQLQEVLTGSLRRGDVVSKYSGAQFVVMLPAANFENSTMVMERVVSSFYRQHRRNFLKLSYKIRALD